MTKNLTLPSYMREIFTSKKTSKPLGIFSICSSNPLVIEASIIISGKLEIPILIESTCNQVNQFGGYTGLNPDQFFAFIHGLAEKYNFPNNSIFLGGDHLGPEVWSNLPSTIALENAVDMIRFYVRAGYKKIHFDASMRCADDLNPLPADTIYQREAMLCSVAVEECKAIGIDLTTMYFVVGTEVPAPGGSTGSEEELDLSTVEETRDNINRTQKAFDNIGLEEVWHQIIAFVVQPGVEYGNDYIHHYDRRKAKGLTELIKSYDNLVFEAHSTDYQTKEHLREMVEDHFAIIKVGPALTFAMREAIMSLELIEKELFSHDRDSLSNLGSILEKAMVDKPEYWNGYYSADPELAAFQRRYSLLDRSRYYWAFTDVDKALHRLINNLSSQRIPRNLLSQFLPLQSKKIQDGILKNTPYQLIYGKVWDVIADYTHAVGLQNN